MKKLLIILLSALSLTAVAQQKPKIAVYMTGDDPMNEIIANRLMASFISSGKYMPVERSAAFLAAVSKEHSYERSGEVDDEQIAELGKQYGIKYLCVVSVVDVWNNEKYITSRILDVTSAEVIGSCSSNGSIADGAALMSALDDLSRNLSKALDYSKNEHTQKVAVYVSKTGNKDVDVILGDQLVAGFSRSGDYIAVERTNAFLKQIQKETGYQQSGAVDDEDLIRLGEKFGVQYVCVTKTIPWGGSYFISSRLIDVKTSEVPKMYNAENKVMKNSQDVLVVAKEIAANLSKGTFVEQAQEKAEQDRKNAEIEAVRQKYLQAGYVDLGLPSGTWWKTEDEKDICQGSLITKWTKSFVEPISSFLPTQEDFQELNEVCSWEIVNERNRYWYKVTGPNGTSITFQLRFRDKYDLNYCTNFSYKANYLTSSIYTKETKKRDYKFFITERLFLDVCGGKRKERRLLDNEGVYGEIYVRFVQKNIFQ